MNVGLYHTSKQLKKLARQKKDPKIAVRIRAVYPALMAKTAEQIAENLGYCRRTVQRWIQQYNRYGLEGIKDAKEKQPQNRGIRSVLTATKSNQSVEQGISKAHLFKRDSITGSILPGGA